jgi:hypothetical protein
MRLCLKDENEIILIYIMRYAVYMLSSLHVGILDYYGYKILIHIFPAFKW